MDNSFLEEIEDEIKRDKLFAFWTAYKKQIVITFVSLILIIIGYLQWLGHQREKAESVTKQIIQIFFDHSSQKDVNARIDGLLADCDGNLAELFSVAKEAIKLKSSVADISKEGYTRLAELSQTCSDLVARDLAIIVQTAYDMDHSPNYPEMMQRLELITFTRRPFRLAAMEMLGVIALKTGDKARALSCFESILKDPDATQNMHARASLLKNAI